MAGNRVVLTFVGEDGPLQRTLAKVKGETDSLGPSLLNVGKGLGALGSAGSAVQVLGGVAGAATQLAGIAFALPAALLAGAAAMATFKVATGGVKEALNATAPAASSSGASVASAARQIAQAQRSITDALKNEVTAQKDVATARKEALAQLEDLRRQTLGAALDQEGAQINVAEAEKNLSDTMKDSTKTALDRRKATYDVAVAQAALSDVNRTAADNATKLAVAEAKGVDGSDVVVAAQKKLADAHQSVIDAQQQLTDLMASQAEAAAKATGGTNAYAAALAKLSPNAREFVTTLRSMGPAWDAVKNSVQDRFFAGLAGDVRGLAGSYLPVLKTGMDGIAGSMNGMARSAAGALMAPASVEAVRAVMAATGTTLGNMKNSLADVIGGFLQMGGVGASYLPAVGTAIEVVTGKFKAWVASATADGSMRAMIDSAIAGFRDLGGIVENVGSIVGSIFRGLGTDFSSPLESLRLLSDRVAAFFQEASTQETLTMLGELLKTAASTVRELFITALEDVRPALDLILPPLTDIVKKIGDWAPVLVPLVAGLAGLKLGVDLLSGAFKVYNGLVEAWSNISKIATAAQWLWNAALSMNPIGLVVIAIGLLVAGFLWLWFHVEGFRNFFIGVWDWIKKAAADGASWVVDKVTAIGAWFRDLPGLIGRAVGNLGSLLWNAGRDLLTGLWNGIVGAAGWLKDKVLGFFGSILPDWAKNILGIHSPSKLFADEIGKFIPEGLALGIDHNVGTVITSAQNMTDAAVTAAQLPTQMGQGQGWQSQGASALAPPQSAPPGGVTVKFTGNTSDALATVIMQMVRTGQIQLVAG